MRARTVMVGLALAPILVVCGSSSRLPVRGAGPGVGQPAPRPSAPARAEAPGPEPRGSEDWRISKPALHGEVAAYTTLAGGVPGTRVGLKVSTTEGGYEVSAYRIGSYPGGTGAFVWESGFRLGRQQPAPRYASYERRTVVAPWKLPRGCRVTRSNRWKIVSGASWSTAIQ